MVTRSAAAEDSPRATITTTAEQLQQSRSSQRRSNNNNNNDKPPLSSSSSSPAADTATVTAKARPLHLPAAAATPGANVQGRDTTTATASPSSRNGSKAAAAARKDSSAASAAYSPSSSTAAKPDESGVDDRSKKRRKVNHACIYCRRSHMTCDLSRPCSRCVKRDIGHLCHDEPREPKKTTTPTGTGGHGHEGAPESPPPPPQHQHQHLFIAAAADGATPPQDVPLEEQSMQTDEAQATSPSSAPSSQLINRTDAPADYNNNGWNSNNNNNNAAVASSNLPPSNELPQDLFGYHPNYMFNTSEVTNEYNLISDFLSTSLLDDGSLMGELPLSMFNDPSFYNLMGPLAAPTNMLPPASQVSQATSAVPPAGMPAFTTSAGEDGTANISRALAAKKAVGATATTIDKAQEKYYMTAADPADAKPDERMQQLLKAKHEAGLLKPFNYIQGYKRLHSYMEGHLEASSRQRIQRQLQRFRPEFRKRVSELDDLELVGVEMWFEKKLMEYDRVFASMAIPACCWRRTGEIFRGNREMAELIKVPVEQLRDGKLSIHEMMVESSLVAYWEKFGSIAFDTSRKAVLTSCWLQTPESSLSAAAAAAAAPAGDGSDAGVQQLKCSFSFTVQRDKYQIPTLIIGNFLPILPSKSD